MSKVGVQQLPDGGVEECLLGLLDLGLLPLLQLVLVYLEVDPLHLRSYHYGLIISLGIARLCIFVST
jgi:hypothetical protein